MNGRRKLFVALTLKFLLAGAAMGQQPASPEEALRQVEDTLRQAQRGIQQFRESGGKPEDPNHPVLKWADALWQYRLRYPGTAAAAKGTTESIHLLVHAERFQQVRERADSLEAGDRAWETLAGVLLEAATLRKDFGPFIERMEALLLRGGDAQVRAALHYQLGRARWQQGEHEKAGVAFQAAQQDAPGSQWAKEAESSLYELTRLSPGQAAPTFSAQARDGKPVTQAGFRGRAVVLVFWSTT